MGCAETRFREIEVEIPPDPELKEAVGTFERRPDHTESGFIRVGRQRYVLVGARVRELEHGRRYVFTLETLEQKEDGVAVRRLVDFRKVARLVGTIGDDHDDASVLWLHSLHDRSYALTGATVASYKEIRSALPGHDYTKTLFRVSVAPEKTAATRFQWLDYTPVALFACRSTASAATSLDLVSVEPRDDLLDGFIVTAMGNEPRFGARATCTRDGAAYGCTFDDVNGPWGSGRFVPGAPTTPSGGFPLSVSHQAETLMFDCLRTDAETISQESEDASF